MNRKLAIIIALQALLIVILFWVLVFYGKDEYEAYTQEQADEIESPNRVSTDAGATVVTLSAAVQQQSEIKTSTLQAGAAQNTLKSLGNVLSIDGLITLRSQYLSAKADAEIARASLSNSQQEFQRLSTLNQDDHNVSDRAVMAAQSAYKTDQAKIKAAEIQASNIMDNMRQTWGEALAKLAVQQPASTSFEALLQHKEVLVQIVMPLDNANAAPGSINILPINIPNPSTSNPNKINPGTVLQARLVSSAPRADASLQGNTYFYRATASNLRVGMRVSIQLDNAHNQHNLQGVIVPASAVVWYGGKAWVYKRQAPGKFIRMPVQTDSEVDGGWFNIGKLQVNDELVTSGAQLLLSEEFKFQIKNENED